MRNLPLKQHSNYCFYVLRSPLCLFAQLSDNIVGKYLLNNSAADISGNEYSGTLNATTAETDRFGVAGAATGFIKKVSSGTLPLALVTALSNDFSLGYWFNTTLAAEIGIQWYHGNAMVDAEVCGGTTDWGTAMIDGGKVCFGIGPNDITIKSANNYNDGNWHFVKITRDKIAATIKLYVDGISVASSTGITTESLGCTHLCWTGQEPLYPNPMYTGMLDDIVAYNTVLSNTEVTSLYNYYSATTLPL